MKLVWKCAYCEETNKNKNHIKEHEKICKYNPNNKGCYTCQHHVLFCSDEYSCTSDKVDKYTYFDVEEKINVCPYYEKEI